MAFANVVKKIRSIRFAEWTLPLALLAACLLAYAFLIPKLGRYWDDWPMSLFLHDFGPAGFGRIFTVDRPFVAPFYTFTSALVGGSTQAWHWFAIFTRLVWLLAVWWFLRLLWPGHARQAGWVALLLAVYPGFKQQPIAMVYGNAWLLFTTYFLSMGLMLLALRQKGWRALLLHLGAMLFSAANLFPAEYYFGMEFLRPVILWVGLARLIPERRARLRRTLLLWAPYLGVVAVYLYWRVFIFTFPGYKPETLGLLASGPLREALRLAKTILVDGLSATFLAWVPMITPDLVRLLAGRVALYFLGAILAAGLAALVYLAFFRPGQAGATETDLDRRAWARQAALVGAIAVFLAGWPFWIANLPVRLEFPYDRFTLAFMPGSVLLLVALVELILPRFSLRVAFLSALIGLAVGTHVLNAVEFRGDWEFQKRLFWQLTWRAPGLEPGTLILSGDLIKYDSDNSLTAPLNWTYAPENRADKLPYMWYYLSVRRQTGQLPGLERGLPIRHPYRTLEYEGSTSQILVVDSQPPACLRVMDPAAEENLPPMDPRLRDAVGISNLDQVVVDADPPARPPEDVFGPEPVHGWCYYFEKADLARQMGDWDQVIAWGEQAAQQGFAPAEPTEKLIFAEAYARRARWQDAARLVEDAIQERSFLKSEVCKLWWRVARETPASPENQAALDGAYRQFQCPQEPPKG